MSDRGDWDRSTPFEGHFRRFLESFKGMDEAEDFISLGRAIDTEQKEVVVTLKQHYS
jgi:hypothetical protein